MKAAVAFSLAATGVNGEAPVSKVISMLSDLQAKVTKEGAVAEKDFAEYSEWCEDRARNVGFEIKTGKSQLAKLNAAIAEEVATQSTLTSKVDEHTASISVDESDLKAATTIRKAEASDFANEESMLMESIDVLRRATTILEREMKGGASLAQLKGSRGIAQALSTMVKASLISTSDASKLTAFVQDAAADDDEEPGAPAGAVYENHSGDIVDTLESLGDKAESQLSDLRKKEMSATTNFDLLKQSLVDEIRFANADLEAAKNGLSASAERKATAEGDLAATSKELSADIESKSTLEFNCQSKAEAYAAEKKSRAEELDALAKAKAVLSEATGVSFLQVTKLSSSADLAKYDVVRFVRDLARREKSGAMMQLASHIGAALHTSDPFGKVKGLITDMIDRLELAAGADATEKAYCDKELSETHEKKDDKTAESKKITTRIDQSVARSAELKEEIAHLENALSKLMASQAGMDKLRQEEKATFVETKAELEKGLTGIKAALQILSEYYAADDKAHEESSGAAGGIISLLEVVEADFSKNLAGINSDEEAAVNEYVQTTKANDIEKVATDQDVLYKTKEAKYLDKTTAELTADRSGVEAELAAVSEYLAQLEKRCIVKAETFESRKARYTAEIAGLKQALTILESDTALVQRHSGRRTLRGARRV